MKKLCDVTTFTLLFCTTNSKLPAFTLFESCVWRTVSSHSSHHPQNIILAQFSLYVHKGDIKPHSFIHLHSVMAVSDHVFVKTDSDQVYNIELIYQFE